MKTFAKISIMLFVFLFGFIQGGYSQIGTTINDDPLSANPLMSCPPVSPDIIYNSDFSVFHHVYIDTTLTYTNVCSWLPAFGNNVDHQFPVGLIGITGGAMKIFITSSGKFNETDSAGGFYQNNSFNKNQYLTFHLKFYCHWHVGCKKGGIGIPLSGDYQGVRKLIVCLTNDSVELLYHDGVCWNTE